mmetsp:Transcript_57533/g.136859  ORF Transcript_57533/g.136859 Transcript_57533/m.136859 type:complete len:462 (-) Transcript_57533:85-1470(-)
MADVPDLRLALQRRGGAYRRPGSTASAPPEVSSLLSPASAAKAGLGWLSKGLAALAEDGDTSQQATSGAKDDSTTSSRSGRLLGNLANGLFSPLNSPATPEKKSKPKDDRLKPRFQARGGVVARPDMAGVPVSPISLAPVKEEAEVEPYLDSMEKEALARLEGMEDLTTAADLSDGERTRQSEEVVADFEFESAPVKETEVRVADELPSLAREEAPATVPLTGSAEEAVEASPAEPEVAPPSCEDCEAPLLEAAAAAADFEAVEAQPPAEVLASPEEAQQQQSEPEVAAAAPRLEEDATAAATTATPATSSAAAAADGGGSSSELRTVLARRRTWSVEASDPSAPQASPSEGEQLQQQGSQSLELNSQGAACPPPNISNNKFRDLREFWGKTSVGFASSGTKELSLTEAQAKLQRLSSCSQADLNEVRELRKRISMHGPALEMESEQVGDQSCAEDEISDD